MTATYTAALTPPGTSAIAVVAIDGPHAWQIVCPLFRPLSARVTWPPAEPNPNEFWLGRFGDVSKDKTADEVVLAVTRWQPHPQVEIHCHGGIEVVRWILELLADAGAQTCSWQDFLRHTDHDPLRAMAAAQLAEASTARTAGILLDQYHGALRRALTDIQIAMDEKRTDDAKQSIGDLLRYADVGRHLTTPRQVAVMGAPNVGKSCLVNAIAGIQRSIVAPTPGTTRDVVTTRIAIDGWPVELIDTAGLRSAVETLENQGIELARNVGQTADLCLWVLDASEFPVWPEPALQNVRLIVNKIDLPSTWDLNQAAGAIHVSAQTGAGMADLIRQLGDWLVSNAPIPGDAVPFTPAIADRLEEVRPNCHSGALPHVLAFVIGDN